MTWQDFFSWLKANGVAYFNGDIHYAGRGYWYPQPPELDGSEDPRPPEPWLRVIEEREGKTSVFIETSFDVLGSKATYAETPLAAQATVAQALIQLDTMLGAEPLPPPRRYPDAPPPLPTPPRGRTRLPGSHWKKQEKLIEEQRRLVQEKLEQVRGAQARNRGGRGDSPEALQSRIMDPAWRDKPDLQGYGGRILAEIFASQVAVGTEHELEHTTDRRIARQIALDHLREDPNYYVKLARAGLGGHDEGVSPSCDLGHHRRCRGCDCACHQ